MDYLFVPTWLFLFLVPLFVTLLVFFSGLKYVPFILDELVKVTTSDIKRFEKKMRKKALKKAIQEQFLEEAREDIRKALDNSNNHDI